MYFLHEHDIVHRDLKPGNVLLSENLEEVKICDFGIARMNKGNALDPQRETTPNAAQRMTYHFAAPEVLKGQPGTKSSDVRSPSCYGAVHGGSPRCLPR